MRISGEHLKDLVVDPSHHFIVWRKNGSLAEEFSLADRHEAPFGNNATHMDPALASVRTVSEENKILSCHIVIEDAPPHNSMAPSRWERPVTKGTIEGVFKGVIVVALAREPTFAVIYKIIGYIRLAGNVLRSVLVVQIQTILCITFTHRNQCLLITFWFGIFRRPALAAADCGFGLRNRRRSARAFWMTFAEFSARLANGLTAISSSCGPGVAEFHKAEAEARTATPSLPGDDDKLP
ncbi:hypothetical protein PsorP6_015993 [Peronosclerospora sorghi]|uniref:Uncharacterized protein n=1 Tax=Peronosclerospora sorghi TaxID=230839 RepID=A0ACC0WMJ0_9STRA|nr:hypothetical protein PsorP6_015993 [Peronosclerospora sorghi]